MRKTALSIVLAGALAAPAIATAQASVDVHFDLPVVLPRLVVVSPGIQVVPDMDREVFFVDGWYWVRNDGGWVRSRDHRGGWVVVPGRRVPPGLARIPPGRYKHWKAARPGPAVYREGGRGANMVDHGAVYRVEDRDHDRGHDRGHGHGYDKQDKKEKRHGRD